MLRGSLFTTATADNAAVVTIAAASTITRNGFLYHVSIPATATPAIFGQSDNSCPLKNRHRYRHSKQNDNRPRGKQILTCDDTEKRPLSSAPGRPHGIRTDRQQRDPRQNG